MIYLTVLLGFVFFAGIAMTINEGLWNNLVATVCILLAGVASMVVGLPVGATLLEKSGKDSTFTWYFLFGGVWLTFFLTVMVLRVIVDRASPVRVRFIPQLDRFVGPLVGLLAAVLFTSLLALSLLRLPVAAGEWKVDEKPAWASTWMQRAATPMNSVMKRIENGEGVDLGI